MSPQERTLGRRAAKAYRAELPFSKQFSPHQISLKDFIDICATKGGDKANLQGAINTRFWKPTASGVAGDKQKQEHYTMAYNALLSARHYGILDEAYRLTPFGQQLQEAKTDTERHRILAIHILTKLNGAEMVTRIEAIRRSESKLPEKVELAKRLRLAGLFSNPDGTDINLVAAWLRKAGIYKGDSGYDLDDKVFGQLTGVSPAAVAAASTVDAVGQAILQELAQSPSFASTSGDMQKRLAGRADLRLNVAQFKKAHLDPLEAAGFIRQEKTTVGRGGRPMRFEATPLFHEQVVQRLIEQARQAGTEMPEEALQVPMSELLDRMRSSDRDTKGKALEQFALRLLLRLGLQGIRWRHRAANAEEIDGMAVSFSPVHSRWQVQCKNTSQLDVEDAAKEVGIAVRQRSTTVLLVTTGEFTPGATNYIDDIIRRSPYTMLRFNGTDVQAIADDPGAIWELLRREALRADELRKQ